MNRARATVAVLVFFGASDVFAAPELQFRGDPSHPAHGSVDLVGLDGRVMEHLRAAEPPGPKPARALSIHVADGLTHKNTACMPSILGSYTLLHDRVRFTPRYPFRPGLRYRARANLEALRPVGDPMVSRATPPASLELEFSMPKMTATVPTDVEAVYPSAGVVPENLLRFYVQFSAPMQRGGLRDHIYLRAQDGRRVEAAFLELATELWDPSMQRLTLLLAPGRIKRGVGPNMEGGTPLREGEDYSLVIDAAMKDATGTPLRATYEKRFRVSAAKRKRVDPETWKLDEPPVGTVEPVLLRFTKPLDRAMLARSIRVVDSLGQPVSGHIEVFRDETRWKFSPAVPWIQGPHQLLVSTVLEDMSGNNVRAPLDVTWRTVVPTDDPPVIVLPFAPRLEPEGIGALRRISLGTTESSLNKPLSTKSGD